MDEILGRSSGVSGSESRRPPPFSGSASSQYGHPKGNSSSSSYVPLVPLPADMFPEKSQNPNEDGQKAVTVTTNSSGSSPPEATNRFNRISESNKYGDDKAESKVENKEQSEKSERWFKKVAELHDVADLSSAISDEIMPMRKGESRFVVSKKKDRSLTFPPYYFAKKPDEQQPNDADSTQKVTGEETSLTSSTSEKKRSEKLDDGIRNKHYWEPTENQTKSPGSWNSGSSENSVGAHYRQPTTENQMNSPGSWNSSSSPQTHTTNLDESSFGSKITRESE